MKFNKKKVCEILKKEIDSDYDSMEEYFDEGVKELQKERLSSIRYWENKLARGSGDDERVHQKLLREAKESAKMENIEYSISRQSIARRCDSKDILNNLCSMLKLYRDICE